MLGKNTLPFPAFGNVFEFVSPRIEEHYKYAEIMPKHNISPSTRFFPHKRSVTKSSTARFSHENLVEKFKIFVQDFVPIRTALMGEKMSKRLGGIKRLQIQNHYMAFKQVPRCR